MFSYFIINIFKLLQYFFFFEKNFHLLTIIILIIIIFYISNFSYDNTLYYFVNHYSEPE